MSWPGQDRADFLLYLMILFLAEKMVDDVGSLHFVTADWGTIGVGKVNLDASERPYI